MHRALEKLTEEFLAMLPPTIFFFVWLHIITVVRLLMAKGSHYEPLSTLSISVWALVLGKAVLIAPPVGDQSLSPQTARLQRGVEDGDLPAGRRCRALLGAALRLQPGGWWRRRRQREAARRNRVAA